MQKLSRFYTRIVTLLMLLLTRVYVWAQDAVDDDDELSDMVPTGIEEDEEDMIPSLFNFHFGYTDILIGAVIIAIFYVMSNSKLKKGCWYSVLYCILVILLINKCT